MRIGQPMMSNSEHSAVCLPSNALTLREHSSKARNLPPIADESRIAGIWEAKMAIRASSSLKRSRALPNCSREDRIRDGPFKCRR
jgi:hypothetical protein